MKIRELIEKTKERPLAEIARDELTVGEKTARRALTLVGGRTIIGQPGWVSDQIHPHDMERSLNSVVQELKHLERQREREAANLKQDPDDETIIRKRHSFDLDVRLMKELKVYCVANDLTLYEAVETAVRDYLDKHKDGEGSGE